MNDKLIKQGFRVLSPNTFRAYQRAARDFEAVTGRPVDQADIESIEAWKASMAGRGWAVNTIRRELSAVSALSGVKVELPKREKVKGRRLLSADQVRIMMSVVTKYQDRMLLVQLLTLGSRARMLNQTPGLPVNNLAAEIPQKSLNAQQATRLVKRYARRAGLNEKQINMMVWCQTGRQLLEILGPIELAKVIGRNPEEPEGIDFKPFHGIGRRKRRV
jgi:hypothetical protein